MSPRPPPKISYKENWMCDLDSDSNKDNQRIEPKPKPDYQVRGDPYVGKILQRKSRHVLCLITMMTQTQQEGGDPYVDQNPQSVAC